MSKMLASGGQIIVEVPNADDELLTFYNNEPFSNFTYWSCHLFLYTAKTLQMLFAQRNLKVNYIKKIQRCLQPFVLAGKWQTRRASKMAFS